MRKDKQKSDENNAGIKLKIRTLTLRGEVKKGFDYTTLYEYEYGKQTKRELDKIRQVWNLKLNDEAIVENLEKLIEKMPK